MATQHASIKRPAPRLRPARQGRSNDLLGSLKIWQKLVLIALAFTVPLLITIGLLIVQQNKEIAFGVKELQGLTVVEPLSKMMLDVPTAAGLSTAYLAGNATVKPELDEQLALIDRSVSALATTDVRNFAEFAVGEDIAALRTAWQNLKAQGLTLSADENRTAWSNLVGNQLVPLILKVGNNSNLILDPDIDTYYAMDVVINKLPELAAELSDIQTSGQGTLQVFSAAQRTRLTGDIDLVGTLSEQIDRSLAFAAQTSPGLIAPLQQQSNEASAALTALTTRVRSQIINTEAPNFDPAAFSRLGTTVHEAYGALNASSLAVLAERLRDRIDRFQRNQLIALTLIALVVAAAFLLVATVARRISGPISQLFSASSRLSNGDLSARASVASTDELGALAKTFNASVEQLQLKARTDAEVLERNRELQGNIGNFLDVAMDIAGGDFTKRGVVSEDALGNVVDAINLMVEELNGLLQDVQQTAFSVRDGAGEMIQASGAIGERSRLQVTQAQGAREEVQRVTSTMLTMAQDADASADAARRALTASQEGEAAVQSTLSGMQGIRREVQGISKRVKGLGDRSLEISEIVETISRISRQTNLLALNAAIEAAGAGEAGGRFAIVANEVRKLADDSASATQRVAALIKTVQSEVQEVVGSVEGGTREVEEGYRVATEAGERLREISQIVTQAAEYAQNISAATQQQVLGVGQVSSAVESIAGASEASQEQVAQGGKTAQRLEELAAELANNLSRFRLA